MLKKLISLIFRNRVFIVFKSKNYSSSRFYFRGKQYASFIGVGTGGFDDENFYKESTIAIVKGARLISFRQFPVHIINIEIFHSHLETFICLFT